MTAWQDQPPISRRQVRQNERDEIVGAADGAAQNSPDAPAEGDVARSGWDADARRASAPQGPPATRAEAAIASGRRVQRPATNETEGEQSAGYATAEPAPYRSRDSASGGRRAAFVAPVPPMNWAPADITANPAAQHSGADAIVTPITATTPVAEPPAPEVPAAEVPAPEAPDAPVEPPVLEQHAEMPAAYDAPAAEPTAYVPPASWAPPTPVAPDAAPERPLTRRELRALGLGGFAPAPVDESEAQAQAQSVSAAEAPVESPVLVEPMAQDPVDAAPVVEADPVLAAQVEPEVAEEALVQEAPVERVPDEQAPDEQAPVEEAPPAKPRFRDRFRAAPIDEEPAEAAPIIAEVIDAPVAAATEPDVQFIATPADEASETVDAELVPEQPASDTAEPEQAETPPAFEDLLFPSGQPVETTVEPERVDSTPTTFDAFVDTFSDDRADDAVAPFTPPVGHWSTQADIDDDEQVQESTFGRDVAATSGAITTSALVLPSVPTAEDIMGPLSGTGEILITGSINLPSSMGSTGVHPARYDHSDVDALLEADDREDSDPESAPVRAIRAISTNTASGDVINSMKPAKNSHLPVILIVTASVVGVAAVVLLVVGMVTGIFN